MRSLTPLRPVHLFLLCAPYSLCAALLLVQALSQPSCRMPRLAALVFCCALSAAACYRAAYVPGLVWRSTSGTENTAAHTLGGDERGGGGETRRGGRLGSQNGAMPAGAHSPTVHTPAGARNRTAHTPAGARSRTVHTPAGAHRGPGPAGAGCWSSAPASGTGQTGPGAPRWRR